MKPLAWLFHELPQAEPRPDEERRKHKEEAERRLHLLRQRVLELEADVIRGAHDSNNSDDNET